MAWSRAEDEVRAFLERTQIPFLRSPMGKGVVPDDHPLSVAAARTLALQNADVVFLCRGPEGPEGRPRRGDEPPRPRSRQRRDLAGRRPKAAAVPLAQLSR
jgi:hypothetical protein